MFFSYQILIRKNGNFAVIWRYMHGPRDGHSKVSKKELLDVNIGQACTDLRGYVPTGRLDKLELQNKMSLYLLAQLSYGVTLVLNVQAGYLISDLQTFLNNIGKPPGPPPDKPQRKRRATEAATPGMEQEGDFDDIPIAETPRTRKKRRTTQSNRQSLLDLSDPRSYVDQQIPLRHKDRQDENGLQELHEDFMDTAVGLPPLEWTALIGEQENETRQQKISIASLRQDVFEDDSIRKLEKSLGVATAEGGRDEINMTNGHIEERRDGERRETIEDLFGPELPLDDTREPIYRQNLNRTEETSFVQDFEEIRLDALPDLEMPPPAAVPRRRRQFGIIYDEQTQLTDDQIQQQINNVRGIVRGNEDFRRMFLYDKQPPLSQLLNPFPDEFLDEQFRPLFEHVTKNYRERPLTFQEAQHLTSQQLHERRFDAELDTWRGSITPNDSIVQNPLQKVSVANLMLPPEESLVEDSNRKRPSTPLDIEFSRRVMQESMSDRRRSELIPLEESMQEPQSFQFDQSIEQMRDAQFGDDIRLERESIFVKPSPDVHSDDDWDEEMNQLYNNIVNKLEGQLVVYFHDVANVNDHGGERNNGRKRAARKFFTLLKLLKHQKIRVRQMEPYGKIMIRLMRQSEDLLNGSFNLINY